jgi:hypothetical protein
MRKGRSKYNAFKHGVFANEVMLWGEEEKHFQSRLASLYDEWFPNACTEEYQVQTLASLIWRRGRLNQYLKYQMEKELSQTRENNETNKQREALKALAPKFRNAKSVDAVETLLSELDPMYSSVIRTNWPIESCEDHNTWGLIIDRGLSSWKSETEYHGPSEFIKIVNLFPMDQELALIERIDAMIDRTVKRLLQLKSMKQMFYRIEPMALHDKGVLV